MTGPSPRFPSLYQINTRVWLREQGGTLDDIPDATLAAWAEAGFDWIWMLGVWQTGPAARAVSLRLAGYHHDLPDVSDADVTGSPFAIRDYHVHTDFGGDAALARLRERLRRQGLRLLLDFVPNHTAPDHPWTESHPEFFIRGQEDDRRREPHNYVQRPQGIFAHGRDPYFDGWTDTVQLNYRHAGLRAAMVGELRRIAEQCDGVRCDMAMLVLPDVIERTWGERSRPSDGSVPVDESFWSEAVLAVRARHPDFVFMAEVYWDREWDLQQQGFDYTYDKRLYDRLHGGDVAGVRGHLHADAEFQRKSVRFLENHDEPRAARQFPLGRHEAAALVTYLVPGLRFFHEGQLQGREVHVSMHLGRRPAEPTNEALATFYEQLLAVLRRPLVREGEWEMVQARPAWDGNPTWESFVAFTWRGSEDERLLICVNLGSTSGQCRLLLPADWPSTFVLEDLFNAATYERTGRELYVDRPAWGYHVFALTRHA